MANEKRLIDFEKARKSVMDILAGKVNTPTAVKVSGAMQEATVDAVEVVHSEWTLVIDENDCECIECPLCGEQFYDGDNDTFDKPYNYCPNCGAKMDGDGNG